MVSARPIPISKKCRLCKLFKLLNEFEIDEEKKDKHAAICKEPSLCSCSCDKCIDGKIVKTAFSSMELLLARIESGWELSDDMLVMITSLAYSAGILCEKCETELD